MRNEQDLAKQIRYLRAWIVLLGVAVAALCWALFRLYQLAIQDAQNLIDLKESIKINNPKS